MRDSAYDPPGLEPQFWARPEVRHALERQDIGAIFRLLSKHGISQMRIATAAGLGKPLTWAACPPRGRTSS